MIQGRIRPGSGPAAGASPDIPPEPRDPARIPFCLKRDTAVFSPSRETGCLRDMNRVPAVTPLQISFHKAFLMLFFEFLSNFDIVFIDRWDSIEYVQNGWETKEVYAVFRSRT